jgi:hypothetical protein
MTPPIPPSSSPKVAAATPVMVPYDAMSSKIVIGQGGVHTGCFLKYSLAGDQVVNCLSWTSLQDAKVTALPPTTGWGGDPVVASIGQELIYADTGNAGGPVIIKEIYGQNIVATLQMGNTTNRHPIALVTSSGGCFVFSYRHQPTDNLELDVAYRSASGKWSIQMFSFTYAPIVPSVNMTAQQGTDGHIYLFIARDSSHRISLARFSELGDTIELMDFDLSFLYQYDGALAPHGEHPHLSSAVDYANSRILLSYTTWNNGDISCDEIVSRPVICAVGTNKSKTLVGLSNLWIRRVFPPAWVFATSVGADLFQYQVNKADCGAKGWRMSRFVGNQITDDAELVAGPSDLVASPDGFVLYGEPDRTLTLAQLGLAGGKPKLGIKRHTSGVELTVEGDATGFNLEASDTITGPWALLGAAISQVIPVDRESRFFRLSNSTS